MSTQTTVGNNTEAIIAKLQTIAQNPKTEPEADMMTAPPLGRDELVMNSTIPQTPTFMDRATNEPTVEEIESARITGTKQELKSFKEMPVEEKRELAKKIIGTIDEGEFNGEFVDKYADESELALAISLPPEDAYSAHLLNESRKSDGKITKEQLERFQEAITYKNKYNSMNVENFGKPEVVTAMVDYLIKHYEEIAKENKDQGFTNLILFSIVPSGIMSIEDIEKHNFSLDDNSF